MAMILQHNPIASFVGLARWSAHPGPTANGGQNCPPYAFLGGCRSDKTAGLPFCMRSTSRAENKDVFRETDIK